ncbi:acylphosphatase [Pontibacter qinzhouensis]|uniref:Acylphosphatase n=1 Tax=Pontibacter qinzhouensis TaxID=2603253 RepID=A0A5C8JJI5_9BACT|nr:acylphosphatase [Pontibacter qinzhouensis]TXK37778.1 acylphosphatase [Pontibacter qinzhouensis]
MSKSHIAIRVHGKVQGVFFRESTKDKARELGLTGFVQNKPDGTVYIEAEGTPEALKQLEEWAHKGPSRARVEQVEVQQLESLTGFEQFTVQR